MSLYRPAEPTVEGEGRHSPRRIIVLPIAHFDAVIVGSGINSLVAAALLAQAGWRVCVLERNDRLGGAIRTEELAPGYTHELLASWWPQFLSSPAYERLAGELAARGVAFASGDLPTGTLYPDGEAVVVSTSREANVAELERHAAGDGEAWARALDELLAARLLTAGLLDTELASRDGLALALRLAARLGRRGLARQAAALLAACRDWAGATFRSERAHGLFAPWALHAGLSPDDAGSAHAARTLTLTKELTGAPLPRGGGARVVEALAALVRERGGACETGREATRVVIAGGRAIGVRTADGELVEAERAVLANVTPPQLYLRLLADVPLPAETVAAARRYRFGRAGMVIHLALAERPRWEADERVGRVAVLHLTPGLDGVSRAANEAARGLLPAEPTIVCGQPVAVDPSRAPKGGWILWLQLQEVPSRPRGDAAGELDVRDGTWTASLRERYADRVVARLARHLPNLESALVRRVALSPADLEAANPNLVGGDLYSGSAALDQSLLFRPRPALAGHRTPVEGLWHLGASTHPGPGLRGGSGWLVASALLSGDRRARRRFRQRSPLARRR